MSFSRFLYTDCSGLPSVDNAAGFGVQATDVPVTPRLKSAALEKMLYQPASKLRQQNVDPGEYPPSFVFDITDEWLLLSKGWNYGAAQGAARGGNQLTTVWWATDDDSFGGILPAQLYAQEEGWETEPADSTQLEPLESPLIESDEFELEAVQQFLNEQDRSAERLAALVGGIRQALSRNLKLVVISQDDGPTAAKWLTAATALLPQDDQLKVTFRIFADSAQRPQQRVAVVNPALMQSPIAVAAVSAGLGVDLQSAHTKDYSVDAHATYVAEQFLVGDAYQAQENAHFYLRWCEQVGVAAAAAADPRGADLEDVLTILSALARGADIEDEDSWEQDDFESFRQELVEAAEVKAGRQIGPVQLWAEAAAACADVGFDEGAEILVHRLSHQLNGSVEEWEKAWRAAGPRLVLSWTQDLAARESLDAFRALLADGTDEQIGPALWLYDQLGLTQVAGDDHPLVESLATRVSERGMRIRAEGLLGEEIRAEVTRRLEAEITQDAQRSYTTVHSGAHDQTLAFIRDAHHDGYSAISSEMVRAAAIARLEFLPRVEQGDWDRAEHSIRQVVGHHAELLLKKGLTEKYPLVLSVWLNAHPQTLETPVIQRRTRRLLKNPHIDTEPVMAQAVTELIRVLNGPALQYLPGAGIAVLALEKLLSRSSRRWATMGLSTYARIRRMVRGEQSEYRWPSPRPLQDSTR